MRRCCLATLLATLLACGGPAFTSGPPPDAPADAAMDRTADVEAREVRAPSDDSGSGSDAEDSSHPADARMTFDSSHVDSAVDASSPDRADVVVSSDAQPDATGDVVDGAAVDAPAPPQQCVSPQGFGCSAPWPAACPNGYCCNHC